jgi:atypical dual specificity phosphatase
MCDEYPGPLKKYQRLGIRQLWLPTVDHFEPSLEHLKYAVAFIAEHKALNKRVYVHCRVGHGRSAAVVFAWMLYNNPSADPKLLNEKLCDQRDVRKTLWRQPNVQRFHSLLLQNASASKPTMFRNEREIRDSSWLSGDEYAQNSDSDAISDEGSPDE